MAAAVVLMLAVVACTPPAQRPPTDTSAAASERGEMSGAMLGLRTTIYPVPDLARGKEWYSRALDLEPYFDEPFYVGFNVGGYELGLDPDTSEVRPGAGGGIAYWGVANVDSAVARLISLGAARNGDVQDVGGGIRAATVRDPFGNVIGLLENPHFSSEPR